MDIGTSRIERIIFISLSVRWEFMITAWRFVYAKVTLISFNYPVFLTIFNKNRGQLSFSYSEKVKLFVVWKRWLIEQTLWQMHTTTYNNITSESIVAVSQIYNHQLIYRQSANVRMGLIFAEFATSLKSPKIDTTKINPTIRLHWESLK